MKRIFSESNNRRKEIRRENIEDVLRSIKKEDDFRKTISNYCLGSEDHRQACIENRTMILKSIARRFNNSKHLTVLALVEPEKFVKTLKLQNKGGFIRYFAYSTYEYDYIPVYLDTINPNYDKQLMEQDLDQTSKTLSNEYRIILDIPYPGLISPPETPGKVEGLIYEINFGNGLFHSSAEVYYPPLSGNMDNFVKTIINIVAQEIFTILLINMRLLRTQARFLTSRQVKGPSDLANYLRENLDTSRGTKINDLFYEYKTNHGRPGEDPIYVKSKININIREFRYFPKP